MIELEAGPNRIPEHPAVPQETIVQKNRASLNGLHLAKSFRPSFAKRGFTI